MKFSCLLDRDALLGCCLLLTLPQVATAQSHALYLQINKFGSQQAALQLTVTEISSQAEEKADEQSDVPTKKQIRIVHRTPELFSYSQLVKGSRQSALDALFAENVSMPTTQQWLSGTAVRVDYGNNRSVEAVDLLTEMFKMLQSCSAGEEQDEEHPPVSINAPVLLPVFPLGILPGPVEDENGGVFGKINASSLEYASRGDFKIVYANLTTELGGSTLGFCVTLSFSSSGGAYLSLAADTLNASGALLLAAQTDVRSITSFFDGHVPDATFALFIPSEVVEVLTGGSVHCDSASYGAGQMQVGDAGQMQVGTAETGASTQAGGGRGGARTFAVSMLASVFCCCRGSKADN